MMSSISLRISLFIFSFIFLHSSILINYNTKRFFNTSFKTSYFTIENFYIRFHDKFRSSSLFAKQIRLFFIFIFESMRFRQIRIISYFKSVIDNNHSFESISKITLISIKKHVNSKTRTQST